MNYFMIKIIIILEEIIDILENDEYMVRVNKLLLVHYFQFYHIKFMDLLEIHL